MIIEFSVTNFRSFKHKQTLSLVKAKGDELAATHSFTPGGKTKLALLYAAAVYGANASGKSNLIKAMETMERLVLRSARYQRGDELDVTPFLFAAETTGQPSEFEIFFIADGVRYQYGFSVNKQRFHDEWLYAYPEGSPQLWFSRVFVAEEKTYHWKFGRQLTGNKQDWRDATRDNALFLSTAVQMNSIKLLPVFDWFGKTLRIIGDGQLHPIATAKISDREGRKAELLQFLKAADLPIDDFVVEKQPFDVSKLPEDWPDEYKNRLAERLKDFVDFSVKTAHKVEAIQQPVLLELGEESDGTQKLFAFAGPLLDVLENGHVLFIDELHNHLHPNLVKFVIGLFHSPATNPKHAQLVFTTHETSVLQPEQLRRDQIWFCQKNRAQATELVSLTEFSPRKDSNLELHYLTGRFGGVPYVGRFEPKAGN